MGLLQEYFYEFELPLLMSTFLGRDTSTQIRLRTKTCALYENCTRFREACCGVAWCGSRQLWYQEKTAGLGYNAR